MTIRFGPFTLNSNTRQLTRADREIHLTPKAFDLLVMLALERPNVVPKAILQERLWPETYVAEANLPNLIVEIREALADRARAPEYIRTAHGVGYAFCGSATVVPSPREQAVDEPACWLECGRRRYPLRVGAHVIGRDADADVRLDHSTVSRRHARLVVTRDAVLLEDFISKNGTFRGGERVTGTVRLVDGDALRIGSLVVTFHLRSAFGSTETFTGSTP